MMSGDGPIARDIRNLIIEPSILRSLAVRNHNPRRYLLSDDLYIMQYSFDPTTVKIGRSYDVEKRRRGLESSHNFRVTTIRVFPGLGCWETRIHAKLRNLRCVNGAGIEWFHLTAQSAVRLLSVYILRRRLWTGCKRVRKGAKRQKLADIEKYEAETRVDIEKYEAETRATKDVSIEKMLASCT